MKSAVEEGLKVMSWAMNRGPGRLGEVSRSWVWGIRRRPPRAVRPFWRSTE